MPIDWPLYRPEPKSGCSGLLEPMRLMMASESGSTGAPAMSVFHRLLGRKGTKPFRLPSGPTLMPLQGLLCVNATLLMETTAIRNRQGSSLRCTAILLVWGSYRLGGALPRRIAPKRATCNLKNDNRGGESNQRHETEDSHHERSEKSACRQPSGAPGLALYETWVGVTSEYCHN